MSRKSLPGLERSVLAARLGICIAALAGTVGMVTQASAAVITFNTPIVIPNDFDGLYINLLTGATGTSGAATPGWDWNPYNSGVSLSFFWNGTPANSSGGVGGSAAGPYTDVAIGSTVSAANTFIALTATANTAAFQNVGTHRVGFRFFNETTSAINYGYATLSTGGATGFPLTVTSWSFENTGAAITVVPEPGTALMLSMGALALGALRLRKARRQA